MAALLLSLKGDDPVIKTTVTIDGMMCSMCEAHINDTIRTAFAVDKVSASHKKGTATILSEKPLDEIALRERIDATGYTVVAVKSEAYTKRFGLFG